MRRLARLGLAVTIAALLFSNANVLAERYAEDLVADGVARAFGLREAPDVDLRGFPILVRALRGDLPDVRFAARDVIAGDLQVASLDVTLRGLRGLGGLLSGPYTIAVADGAATVVVTQASVNAFLRSRDEPGRVRILRGRVRLTTTIELRGPREISASARVRLRGRRLHIEPVPGSVTVDGRPAPPDLDELARQEAEIDVELPHLPGGIAPRAIALLPGEARIAATFDRRRIPVRS